MVICPKKDFSILLSAAFAALGVVSAFYATESHAQPVRFSLPANASGIAGETVTIPLHLDPNGKAVGSFDATVQFTNTLLTYTGFSAGPVLNANDNWFVDVNSDDANTALVIGAFSVGRLTGAGAAVLLKFAVSAAAAGGDSVGLSLHNLAATDTNVVSLPVEGVAGKFTVKPMISGRIRTSAGQAISGVALAGLPENFVTDAGGFYRLAVEPRWSGAITPQKNDYTFDPPLRQYAEVTRDQFDQDYLATEIVDESFAFPNPFNPAAEPVQIRFVLQKPANASVKILDGGGEMVREFPSIAVPLANPVQVIQWDGRNGRGDLVDSGVYFYIITAPANPRVVGKIGVTR
jgi:hypothetical protein